MHGSFLDSEKRSSAAQCEVARLFRSFVQAEGISDASFMADLELLRSWVADLIGNIGDRSILDIIKENDGAFEDFGKEYPALLHLSWLQDQFVYVLEEAAEGAGSSTSLQ